MSNTLSALMNAADLINQEVERTDGELTPELQILLGLNEALVAEKIDSYDFIMKRLELESSFLKSRADEYIKASKARLTAVENMKNRIKALMLIHDKREISGEYVKLGLYHTNPTVIVDNELEVPSDYFEKTIVMKLRKDLVKDTLKAGFMVPGCHLQESFSLRSFPTIKKIGDT